MFEQKPSMSLHRQNKFATVFNIILLLFSLKRVGLVYHLLETSVILFVHAVYMF